MTRSRKPSNATMRILNCLVGNVDGLHGYGLMQDSGLASGTLYPILKRLSDRGWLVKKWDTPSDDSGPPRRIYKLTDLGRKNLEGLRQEQMADPIQLKQGRRV